MSEDQPAITPDERPVAIPAEPEAPKPRARRSRKAAAGPEHTGGAVDPLVQQATGRPDVFDQAIAARQTTERQPGDDGEDQRPGAPRRNGITKRGFPKVPERATDPFGGLTLDLTPKPDGMRARFLRSNEHGDVWIQFSQNPGKAYTGQLGAEGFRWEPRAQSDLAKGAWVLELEPGQEWRNHARGEQAFLKVANRIREANGLEEFVPMAGRPR